MRVAQTCRVRLKAVGDENAATRKGSPWRLGEAESRQQLNSSAFRFLCAVWEAGSQSALLKFIALSLPACHCRNRDFSCHQWIIDQGASILIGYGWAVTNLSTFTLGLFQYQVWESPSARGRGDRRLAFAHWVAVSRVVLYRIRDLRESLAFNRLPNHIP